MSDLEWQFNYCILPLLSQEQRDSMFLNVPAKNPDLPLDIWALVLSFVDLKDVFHVICTCKLFNQAAQKESFWHRHAAKRFLDITGLPIPFYASIPVHSKATVTLHTKYGWIFCRADITLYIGWKVQYRIVGYGWCIVFCKDGRRCVLMTIFGNYGHWKNYSDETDELQSFDFEVFEGKWEDLMEEIKCHNMPLYHSSYTTRFRRAWWRDSKGNTRYSKRAVVSLEPWSK